MFKYSEFSYLKIDLNTNSSTLSILFRKNTRPFNGTCQVDSNKGFAFHTYFRITCQDWTDLDGLIIRYEYFGNLIYDFEASYQKIGIYAQITLKKAV